MRNRMIFVLIIASILLFPGAYLTLSAVKGTVPEQHFPETNFVASTATTPTVIPSGPEITPTTSVLRTLTPLEILANQEHADVKLQPMLEPKVTVPWAEYLDLFPAAFAVDTYSVVAHTGFFMRNTDDLGPGVPFLAYEVADVPTWYQQTDFAFREDLARMKSIKNEPGFEVYAYSEHAWDGPFTIELDRDFFKGVEHPLVFAQMEDKSGKIYPATLAGGYEEYTTVYYQDADSYVFEVGALPGQGLYIFNLVVFDQRTDLHTLTSIEAEYRYQILLPLYEGEAFGNQSYFGQLGWYLKVRNVTPFKSGQRVQLSDAYTTIEDPLLVPTVPQTGTVTNFYGDVVEVLWDDGQSEMFYFGYLAPAE